jgi:hypothetical protein
MIAQRLLTLPYAPLRVPVSDAEPEEDDCKEPEQDGPFDYLGGVTGL